MEQTKTEKKPKKRKVELLVISDIHLGTYGCHSKELLKYLNSIKPKIVVLDKPSNPAVDPCATNSI